MTDDMAAVAPKVFISYSWAVADKVLELAERLVNPGGVDVILDRWDLKEGQDKYVFMEQAVNNPEIIRVLIVCDKTYVQKANERKGGVGDETVIISSEVYGKVGQEKFIPVIFENDESGTPLLPTYIKTRIYIDLSTDENYEEQYEKLLRNLHGKPEYRKPKLSSPPEWLNEEDVSFSTIRNLIKQIKGDKEPSSAKVDFVLRRATDEFFQALKSLELPLDKAADGALLLKRIDATKPIRDYFLDYIETLLSKDLPAGEIIANYFESLHNNIENSINVHSREYVMELYNYFIWESFVCAIAVLLYYEKYGEINKTLKRTYFLVDGSYGESAQTFIDFRHHFRVIEGVCKPNCEEPQLHTLAGEITVKREKKPIITKDSMVNADLILYQMSCALEPKSFNWFPTMCCYHSRYQLQAIWTRLVSKRHCEKLFPLFDVNSIEKLKELISKCDPDNRVGYNTFHPAPNILSSIKLDEIGTLS